MLHDILDTALHTFEITLADLVGPSRAQHLTQARQAVAYALRQQTALSLHEIGAVLGRRDHTTIMHSVKAAEARAVADARYALALTALLRR